jgi:cytidyltransferase-like protein
MKKNSKKDGATLNEGSKKMTTKKSKAPVVKKETVVKPKKAIKRKAPVAKKQPVVEPVVEPTNSVVEKIVMPKTPTRENGIVVLVTGGFDPLHSGHLDYIDSAKDLGREGSWHGAKVVVGVNSDDWLERKKGKSFMPVEERVRLLLAMRNVDQVITFDDSDDSSMNAIHITRHMFPDEHIIFANGGDRNSANINEMNFVDSNLSFSFGVGGDKTQSSSDLLGEWAAPRTERDWGYYRVLHEFGREVKIKELTVDPGKSLSMQRHAGRAEFWFVATGIASVYTVAYPNDAKRDVGDILVGKFGKHDSTWIPVQDWHMLVNNESEPLTICEIQYGDNCIEEDIERVFRNKK